MIKYRAEIDGLRAIAVIPVILFHLGYTFFAKGYYGVDVFFVISGYLITKILTENIEQNQFSMFDFWIRRIKRLMPALLTVILTVLVVAPLLVFKPVVEELSNDIFPAIFSYFNFHALFDFGNYWGGKSEKSFFLHVWSLSVEEQFYLIYPFFLFLVYKYFKSFIISVFALTICSFLFFMFYLNINKDYTFYMLPTRIWELSLGGLMTLIMVKKTNSFIKSLMPIIGILLILLSYLFGGAFIDYTVVLPVIGTALILLFCSPQHFVGKILSNKFFVLIGKLSYSLYLWHWPVIVLIKNLDYQLQDVNKHIINASILLVVFLLAYLTYMFIENKSRQYLHTPKLVFLSIVMIAGITIYFTSYYNIYYKSTYNEQTNYLRYYDISPTQVKLEDNDPLEYRVNFPNRLAQFSDAYKNEGIITKINNKSPEIMLLGDSHGVMWAKLFDEISDELQLSRTIYTSNASKPFFNIDSLETQKENRYYTKVQRVGYAKSIIKNIEVWKPKLFVIACRWEGLNDKDKESLNQLLLFLERKNIKVLLLTQPPRFSFMENKNACQYLTYLEINSVSGFNLINKSEKDNTTTNNYIISLQIKFHNVLLYDVYKNMIENNKVKVSLNKEVLYFDDDHLSYIGTTIHKKNIMKIVRENTLL